MYEFVLCLFAEYSECADAGFRRFSRMREQKLRMVSDRREFATLDAFFLRFLLMRRESSFWMLRSSRTIWSRGLSSEPARTVVYVREEFQYMRCIRT